MSEISKIHEFVIVQYGTGVVRKTMPCGRNSDHVERAFKEQRPNEEVYVTCDGRRYRVNRP